VVYERVYHDAGAHTPMMMSYGEIVRFIRAAGKEPVERDSLYHAIRTFPADDPIFTEAELGTRNGEPSSFELVRLVGAGRA